MIYQALDFLVHLVEEDSFSVPSTPPGSNSQHYTQMDIVNRTNRRSKS